MKKNHILLLSTVSILMINQALAACEEGYIVGVKTGNCIKASDSCGTNCTYTIDDKGNLNITGTGSVKDSAFQGNKDIISANIGYGITSLGRSSFDGTSNMTSVNIPNSVTGYGLFVFQGSSVNTIKIPPTSGIDLSIVMNSPNIHNLILPEGLSYLGGPGVIGSSGISNFVIPDSVKSSNGTYNSTNKQNIYCTAVQISNNICSNNVTRYEKDPQGNYITYNSDGTIQKIFGGWDDFNDMKIISGIYEQKDENGKTIAKYKGNGSLLSKYSYKDDGSTFIYDANGKLIGIHGKRILTIDEATSLVNGNKNTFSIRYR